MFAIFKYVYISVAVLFIGIIGTVVFIYYIVRKLFDTGKWVVADEAT